MSIFADAGMHYLHLDCGMNQLPHTRVVVLSGVARIEKTEAGSGGFSGAFSRFGHGLYGGFLPEAILPLLWIQDLYSSDGD